MKRLLLLVIILIFSGYKISLSGEARITIAVVDFSGKNMSAMDASVATDFLRTAFVNSKYFKVTDRNNMEIILSEQSFQQTGCTTEDCAVKIGNVLNVQEIIIGDISKLGKIYYITANVVDVETCEIVIPDRVECSSQRKLAYTMEVLAQRIEKKFKEEKIREYKLKHYPFHEVLDWVIQKNGKVWG